MFIDTHAHMDHVRFSSNRKEILQDTKNLGVEKIINPAIDYETNETMENVLKSYDWIYYAKGIHPNTVGVDDSADEAWQAGLIHMLSNNPDKRTVAIGETGIDFHRLTRSSQGGLDEEGAITLRRQYKWFRKQMELAGAYELPLVLHIRNANVNYIRKTKGMSEDACLEYVDAHKAAMKVLAEFQDVLSLAEKGVVHCFTSNEIEDAKQYIQMGYLIGIGGAVTYEENEGLREIVKEIPLDRILLETDSPYVMPVGLPGKRNTPLNIPYIAKYVAELKGLQVEEVEEVTTQNAIRLFKLPV